MNLNKAVVNGVRAIAETCVALSEGNFDKGREIISEKYPHKKPLKPRKSFTKKEQLKIFLRDGFIDRYSGDPLIFPGVLCILSCLVSDVFPYHAHGNMAKCHQA